MSSSGFSLLDRARGLDPAEEDGGGASADELQEAAETQQDNSFTQL